ncbi:MAG TPA: hypothetical protein VGI39_05300 [Polyangiaceae bacterium]
MREALLGGWLAVALVAQVAAHVALLTGLALRQPRWRALVALVVPPLAPVWGWSDGMRKRAYAWGVSLAAYALGIAIGR